MYLIDKRPLPNGSQIVVCKNDALKPATPEERACIHLDQIVVTEINAQQPFKTA